MPYDQVGEFAAQLKQDSSISARALEFLILTATRTNEVLGATWEEINWRGKVWTIPAERMKAGREHRVPLSSRALGILAEMSEVKRGPLVFPGRTGEVPMSNMTMAALLKRSTGSGVTVHGFRTTFRTWAAEQTGFAREIAEQALAHTLSDAVEAAYRRTDLLEKRRKLMEAWSNYCAATRKSEVVSFIEKSRRGIPSTIGN
jgi:integrase